MRSKQILYRQFLSQLATSLFSTNSSRVQRSQRPRLSVVETIEPKILLSGVGQDITIQAGQTISGVVWEDANGDGVKDTGELPAVGATVFIDENLSGTFDTGEPTAITDDQGAYQFTDIAPGEYFLLQILPENYFQTFPSLNPNSIQTSAVGTDEFIGPLPPVEPPAPSGSDGPDYAGNRVIIKRAAEQVGSAIAETAFLDIMADSGVVQSESLLLPGLEVWELPAGSVDDFIAQYAHDPRFEFVERDYIVSTTEVETTDTLPNDPSFGTLWGLHNTGQSSGTVDADIDAPEAWDLTTGSSDVIIGVIDTGINYNHVDLVNNIWTNPGEIAGNGIDDDNNGFIDDVHGYDFVSNDGNPMDDEGHGTHVAGTIAAQGNNGTGVTGVTWNAQLMAIKFLDSSGNGSLSNAVKAINYATLMGAHITNNSWGGGGFSSSLQAAITAAGNAGQLFVAAAGNDGAAQANYPALYSNSNILSVASSDRNDLKSSFSNYNSVSVDLAAPGSSIYSTSYTGGYTTKSGTSMATPHVAGAAALLKSLRPTATVSEIKSTLMNTVDPLSAFTGRVVTGGRLNVFNAVKAFYVVPGSHHVIVEDGIDVPDINFGRQEYIPVYDFGDAPDSYGTTLATSGPQHEVIGDLYLGTSIDDEADGIPSPDADGDNLDGTDDEDGVLFNTPLVLNEQATLSVTISAPGELAYWFDWDQSGTFDNATERYSYTALNAGIHLLPVPVPASAVAGDTYARFRVATDGAEIQDPTGIASDGEVEDYLVTLEYPTEILVTTAIDENDGTFDPNVGAGTSLREAILTANSSPVELTIRFDASLSLETITLGIAGIGEDSGLTGDLDITQNMTIEGLSPQQLISIDGGTLDRVFDVHGVNLTLSNLNVTGGLADGYGEAFGGGAIRNNDGNLLVSHSRFSGNQSGYGGAIFSYGDNSVATIRYSTVDDNRAYLGGGVAVLSGTLVLDSSTISNNQATTDGGGVQASNSLVTIHQSTVSGNRALTEAGGGIYIIGPASVATVSQSTIFGNSVSATQAGGGIGTELDAKLTLSGSIVGGNFAGMSDTPSDLAVVGLEAGSSYNLIADAGTAGGLTNGVDGNIVGVDISTVIETALTDNGGLTATHLLLNGSPAIDAGDPAIADGNLVDQRGPGFFRVWNGRIDLGAVERSNALSDTILVTTAVDENDGNTDPARGQGTSLREAIIAANSNPDLTTILFDSSLDGTPIVLTITGRGENAALTGDLDILEDTIIQGNGISNTIIDGNDADRIFELFTGRKLLLDSVKVMNGNETNGGAISSTGELTIRNSLLEGNNASNLGGVVFATSGQVNIYDSSLTGNSALNGGAVYRSSTTTSLTVDNSLITYNTASAYGGAFYLISSHSAFPNTISNSTIAFNNSGALGGAFYGASARLDIMNSTIAFNHAYYGTTSSLNSGGGIYLFSSFNRFQVFNSVVAGNIRSTTLTPDDVIGSLETSSGNNLIGNASTSGGLTNGVKGNIVGVNAAEVLESTLADNGGPTQTLALLPGSVAINAGNQDLTTSLTDQRGAGFERVVAGQVDIGAFEFRGFDFGDAPDSYQTLVASDGPWHIVTGPQLGAGVSQEIDAPTNNGADTFDDGVIFGTADQGKTAQVSVEIAGGNGQARVYGWIDFNQDGKFDGVGEQILDSSVLLADGSHDLNFAVPAGAVVGETQARIRVSTEQGLSWSGGARDGEVEDLLVTIGESNLINLSVSTTEQSEHDPMEITVTATSTLPVVGDQTIELNLSGSATLDKDYAISGIVITILDGQTTGSVTITLTEDVLPESDEEIQLDLTNPSAGVALGTVTTATITILDATLTPNGAFTGLIGFANGQFELSIPDENGDYAAPKFAATSPGSGILDVKYGDFNGDGFEDIAVWLDNGEWHVGLATGRGNFLFSFWGTWRTTGVKEAQVGDFNGDGKDDLAALFQNSNDPAKGRWWVSISDGASFTNEYWGDYGNYDGIAAVLVGNFDGVNGDDLVVVATTGQIWMAKTESNSFRYLRCHRWNLGIGFDFMQAGDYNGDGKTDLFTVLGTGLNRLVFVATSLGPTLGFSNGLWSTWKVNQSLDQVLTGDFNGDGADDVIGVFNGSKLWHGYADGEKFRMKYWLNWSDIAGGTTNLLVGQTNNDHLADILARTNDGLWRTAESTGTGLTTRTLVQWSSSTSWDYVGAGVFSQHTIPTAQSVTELSIGSSNPEESAGQVNVERWQPAAEETGSPAAPVSTGSAATTDSAGVEGTESEFELFGDESLLNLLFRA